MYVVHRSGGASDVVEVPTALVPQLRGPLPPSGFITNGMGPEKLGRGRLGAIVGRAIAWLIPESIAGWDLVVASAWHDHAYDVGGDWPDRRTADLDLAQNVVTIARWADREAGRDSGWRDAGAFLLAAVVASSLRAFGAGAFRWKNGSRPRGLVAAAKERSGVFRRPRR